MQSIIIVVVAALTGLAAVFWAARSREGARGLCSPLGYFALIWIAAFPLRYALITLDMVDTQVPIVRGDAELARGLLLATLLLVAVCAGGYSVLRHTASEPAGHTLEGPVPEGRAASQRRVYVVVTATALASLMFLLANSFQGGGFRMYRANALIEQRVGRGWAALLAEVGTFGLVLLLAYLVSAPAPRLHSAWLGAVLLVQSAAATLMMVALTTRRPVALLLFGSMVVLVMRYGPRRRLLAAVLLSATFLLAPVADAIRYTCIPCLFTSDIEVVDSRVSAGNATLDVVEAQLVGLLRDAAGKGELTPRQQRALAELRRSWDTLAATTLEPDEVAAARTRLTGRLARGVATNGQVPDAAATGLRLFTTPSAPESKWREEFRLPLTRLSSSFEGVDHAAAFLMKASPAQILTGVDHGESWVYNAGLGMLPRAVWSGKPPIYGSVAQQAFLYPHMFETTAASTTLPVTFVVDFAFGFGVPVALLLAFLLGRVMSVLGDDLWDPSAPAARKVFGMYILLNCFNLLRGGTGMLQLLAVTAVLSVLAFGLRPTVSALELIARRSLGRERALPPTPTRERHVG